LTPKTQRDFYKNPKSSELALLLVETYTKEFENGKFGNSISDISKNFHKLAQEIAIYFY